MSWGIFTFRSDRFDTSPLAEGLDPEQNPLGRDLAVFLIAQLKSSPGVAQIDREPDQEHDQWAFDFAAHGKQYGLACHIIDEQTPRALWAIQTWERVGLFRSLFVSGDAFYKVDDAIVTTLASILQAAPGLIEVQHLTPEQFRSVY